MDIHTPYPILDSESSLENHLLGEPAHLGLNKKKNHPGVLAPSVGSTCSATRG